MRRTASLFLMLLVAGCSDHPTEPIALGPPETGRAISDGTGDGNTAFFFLPPLAPQPSFTGVFDPDADPSVEICLLEAGSCDPVVVFEGGDEGGSETVRVDPDEEEYIVNWHTRRTPGGAAAGETYRIQVRVGTQLLGYADVRFVRTGRDLKTVDPGEAIGVVQGRTLPVKFRIEEGWQEADLFPVAVTAGGGHTCASNGQALARCWGWNRNGVLGIGTIDDVRYPTAQPVAGSQGFVSLTTNEYHSCGITPDGDAYCWGENAYGALGDGTTTTRGAPVPVSGGHTFVELSAGLLHTCGLTDAGDVYCWGRNEQGDAGTGRLRGMYTTPVQIAVPGPFRTVAAGGSHTCAITEAQELYCWGVNWSGQLGLGTSTATGDDFVRAPTLVPGLSAVQVSASTEHTCAVADGGQAYCWGRNANAQLGLGYTTTDAIPWAVPVPSPVLTELRFRSLAAGLGFTCGLTLDGLAHCWGSNGLRQLGAGSMNQIELAPVPVLGGLGFERLSTKIFHTCGTTSGGELYCWGANNNFQIGNGVVGHPVEVPTFVMDLNGTQ